MNRYRSLTSASAVPHCRIIHRPVNKFVSVCQVCKRVNNLIGVWINKRIDVLVNKFVDVPMDKLIGVSVNQFKSKTFASRPLRLHVSLARILLKASYWQQLSDLIVFRICIVCGCAEENSFGELRIFVLFCLIKKHLFNLLIF